MEKKSEEEDKEEEEVEEKDYDDKSQEVAEEYPRLIKDSLAKKKSTIRQSSKLFAGCAESSLA